MARFDAGVEHSDLNVPSRASPQEFARIFQRWPNVNHFIRTSNPPPGSTAEAQSIATAKPRPVEHSSGAPGRSRAARARARQDALIARRRPLHDTRPENKTAPQSWRRSEPGATNRAACFVARFSKLRFPGRAVR